MSIALKQTRARPRSSGTPVLVYIVIKQVSMCTQYYSIQMVSSPQMPVPLKHMYNANIFRAEFPNSVPTCILWDTL